MVWGAGPSPAPRSLRSHPAPGCWERGPFPALHRRWGAVGLQRRGGSVPGTWAASPAAPCGMGRKAAAPGCLRDRPLRCRGSHKPPAFSWVLCARRSCARGLLLVRPPKDGNLFAWEFAVLEWLWLSDGRIVYWLPVCFAVSVPCSAKNSSRSLTPRVVQLRLLKRCLAPAAAAFVAERAMEPRFRAAASLLRPPISAAAERAIDSLCKLMLRK